MPSFFDPIEYNLDLVICIDATAGMSSCLDNIKRNLCSFALRIGEMAVDLQNGFQSIRVKLIVFRDYLFDGTEAMQESCFFDLASEQEELQAFLNTVEAFGGGDLAENGREALALAMRADFSTGKRDRHAILLFSDSDALELGVRADAPGYPTDTVDEEGLVALWEGEGQDASYRLSKRRKRMILFAPEHTNYRELPERLSYCFFEPIERMTTFFDDGDIDALAEQTGKYILFNCC